GRRTSRCRHRSGRLGDPIRPVCPSTRSRTRTVPTCCCCGDDALPGAATYPRAAASARYRSAARSSRRDLDLVTRRSLTETPGIAAAIERALSRGCHSHSSHHVAMASRYNGLARAHPASAHRRRVRRDCAAADTYLDELHLVADRRVRAREIWTQHGAQPLFPGRSYCRDVAIKHALICTSDLFGAPGSRAEPCHLHPLFPPTSVRVARAPWTRCPELLRQV